MIRLVGVYDLNLVRPLQLERPLFSLPPSHCAFMVTLAVSDSMKGAFEHTWLLYPENGSEYLLEKASKSKGG